MNVEKFIKRGAPLIRQNSTDDLFINRKNSTVNKLKKPSMCIEPFGCSCGDEVISYKFDDVVYVEGFERLWHRITNVYGNAGQRYYSDMNRVIDTTNSSLRIYDSTSKSFVKVERVVSNKEIDWCRIKLSNNQYMMVSENHPFTVDGEVLRARDLETGIELNGVCAPSITPTYQMEPELAWVYGFILTRLNFTRTGTINIHKKETDSEELINNLKKRMKASFPRIITRAVETKETINYKCDNSPADILFIQELLLKSFGATSLFLRHVPTEIFRTSNKNALYFLAGLVESVGVIDKKNLIKIPNLSKETALQLKLLLNRLNLFAGIKMNSNDMPKCDIYLYPIKDLVELLGDCSNITPYTGDTNQCKTPVVTKIDFVTIARHSYDVTTKSGHFDLSGISSHNCSFE